MRKAHDNIYNQEVNSYSESFKKLKSNSISIQLDSIKRTIKLNEQVNIYNLNYNNNTQCRR